MRIKLSCPCCPGIVICDADPIIPANRTDPECGGFLEVLSRDCDDDCEWTDEEIAEACNEMIRERAGSRR